MKVEKDTPEKPEIFAIASILNLDPEIVFTKCFKIWRWADSQTVDGNAPRVTPARLDELVKMPGFADALSEVGWLHVRTGSLQIPNFGRHMGQGAKKRALTADRVAKSRASDCNAPGVTESAPEKRREEKRNKKSPKPPFVPPTLEEVRAYCAQRQNGIDPERFLAHYQANGWVQGNRGKPIKDWKAAIITWEKNNFGNNGATPHELFLSAEEQVERTRQETEQRRRERSG